MDAQLEARLENLESRMRRVEHSLALPSIEPAPPPERRPLRQPPAPQPEASPAPAEPRTPAPVRRQPSATPLRTRELVANARTPIEWERFFGVAVLGRVGVAAVLLAAGYFAQLAYKNLGPTLRVASIEAVGLAMVAVGAWLRSRVLRRYTAILWGGGVALCYLGCVAAHLRYGIVGPEPTLLLLAVVCAGGWALATRIRHEWLGCIALAGAFAAPLLTASPLDQRTFLLLYGLLLSSASGHLGRRMAWTSVRVVGFAGTVLLALTWAAAAPLRVDASSFLHAAAWCLVLGAPDIVDIVRGRSLRPPYPMLWLLAAATANLLLYQAAATQSALPAFGVLAALPYALLAVAGGQLATKRDMDPIRQAIAGLASVLLILGVLPLVRLWIPTVADASWTDASARPALQSLLLGLLATAVLALRRTLRTHDLAAALAAGLSAYVVLAAPDAQTTLLLLALPLGAIALLRMQARETLQRQAAQIAGALVVALGLARSLEFQDAFTAFVMVGPALWLLGDIWLARRAEDPELLRSGLGCLLVTCASWPLVGYALPVGLWDALPFDLLTLAAGALMLVAAAATRLANSSRNDDLLPALCKALWSVVVLTGFLAGHRELGAATTTLPSVERYAAHVAYLVGAALLLLRIGRPAARQALRYTGAALLALAPLYVTLTALNCTWATGPYAMLALLLPLLGATVLLVARAPRRAHWQLFALGTAGLLILAWGAHASAGRFLVDLRILNWRFGVATLLAGWFGWAVLRSRATLASATRLPIIPALVITMVYVAGLLELLDAIAAWKGAWGRVLVSIYTTLFASALLAVGFRYRKPQVRYAALAGFGFVVLKVGLYDLGGTELPLRILVTGVLGVVLLVAAFAYARRRPPCSVRERNGARGELPHTA